MRIRPSTLIIAAVAAALAVFTVLEFTGVIGNEPGRLPAGIFIMLILVAGLLALDVRRASRKTEREG